LALKTTKNISLHGNDIELKRQEIKTYFNNTFQMKEKESIGFTLPIEGDIQLKKIVSLKSLGLEKEADKVSFFQADACNLKPIYTGYDLIFA